MELGMKKEAKHKQLKNEYYGFGKHKKKRMFYKHLYGNNLKFSLE